MTAQTARDAMARQVGRALAQRRAAAIDAAQPNAAPGTAALLGRYTFAVFRWLRAGCPTRDDATVERLLAVCQSCEFHADGHCRVCGCRVSRGAAVANKLRMATESCPLGRW